MALAACKNPLGSCTLEPEWGGAWVLTLSPPTDAGDGGASDVIPREETVDAQLTLVSPNSNFGLGRYVWGTLTARNGLFDPITIPTLTKNDGSKTGSALGCDFAVKVPLAAPVSDDNVDQGPLKMSLAGTIDAARHMRGEVSTVIVAGDATQTPRRFLWTGVQP